MKTEKAQPLVQGFWDKAPSFSPVLGRVFDDEYGYFFLMVLRDHELFSVHERIEIPQKHSSSYQLGSEVEVPVFQTGRLNWEQPKLYRDYYEVAMNSFDYEPYEEDVSEYECDSDYEYDDIFGYDPIDDLSPEERKEVEIKRAWEKHWREENKAETVEHLWFVQQNEAWIDEMRRLDDLESSFETFDKWCKGTLGEGEDENVPFTFFFEPVVFIEPPSIEEWQKRKR